MLFAIPPSTIATLHRSYRQISRLCCQRTSHRRTFHKRVFESISLFLCTLSLRVSRRPSYDYSSAFYIIITPFLFLFSYLAFALDRRRTLSLRTATFLSLIRSLRPLWMSLKWQGLQPFSNQVQYSSQIPLSILSFYPLSSVPCTCHDLLSHFFVVASSNCHTSFNQTNLLLPAATSFIAVIFCDYPHASCNALKGKVVVYRERKVLGTGSDIGVQRTVRFLSCSISFIFSPRVNLSVHLSIFARTLPSSSTAAIG